MAHDNELDDAGVVVAKNVANSQRDQAGEPEEAEAVTGRANDIPVRDPDEKRPAVLQNSTLASRARARTKQQRSADNKAVTAAEDKAPAKRTTRKAAARKR